ncbi:conserved hypothetical protein [Ricinus communis]|uniref:Uncharacterized protein n=1 Tax=Ricinus communis TaxID=3988 RepID=B9RTL9_RICCO|nr:conserved hypothetical protein [Ricinus communis]
MELKKKAEKMETQGVLARRLSAASNVAEEKSLISRESSKLRGKEKKKKAERDNRESRKQKERKMMILKSNMKDVLNIVRLLKKGRCDFVIEIVIGDIKREHRKEWLGNILQMYYDNERGYTSVCNCGNQEDFHCQ